MQYNTSSGHQVNNEIIIYRYSHHISERIHRENRQFFILIMDTSVQFIEGNIDEEINYSDESLYQSRWKDYDYISPQRFPAYWEDGTGYYPATDWSKVRLGQRFVEIIIENDSGSRKLIRLSTVLESQKEIIIENGMIEIYTIDYNLYILGGVNMSVSDSGWTVNRINFRMSWFREYELLNKITLKLKDNGHEISYN